MDRFNSGNGTPKDNSEEVIEFVGDAVLVDDVDIASRRNSDRRRWARGL